MKDQLEFASPRTIAPQQVRRESGNKFNLYRVKMKILIVVFALCVAGSLGGLTDEQKAKLMGYKQSCITESGVEPNAVENAKRGEIAEDDEKLACFASCYLRHIGVYDAEGNVHEDVFRAKLPADVPKAKADQVVNTCTGRTGSTFCRTGAKLLKCFMESRTVAVL